MPIHLCEFHLIERGRQSLRKDGIGYDHPGWGLLHAACSPGRLAVVDPGGAVAKELCNAARKKTGKPAVAEPTTVS